MCREKLADQVALRAHDLDAVVARLPRELGAAREIGDRLAYSPPAQRPRRERRAGVPDDLWRENLEHKRAGQERLRR